MKNDLHVPHHVAAQSRIAHVARHHFHVRHTRTAFQPAPRVERVVLDQGPHARALSYELLNEMRTDKPVCARHKNSLAFKNHGSRKFESPRLFNENIWSRQLVVTLSIRRNNPNRQSVVSTPDV